MTSKIPVVDMFAGCGGLGEGFSILESKGEFPFSVQMSIENQKDPMQTLLLRTFYHLFRDSRVPDSYYEYLRGCTKSAKLRRSR